MAVFGKSNQLLEMLGQNLYTNPKALTLGEYLEVGSAYPGLTIVNYLINKGVPKTITFSELISTPSYFNDITNIFEIMDLINVTKRNEDLVYEWGQDSGADIPQHGLSIEPQNKFMSYKPTNETIGDMWDYYGYVDYPPVTWTDPNGYFRVFELYYVQSVLADGTLIFEAYDVNYGDYHWVAMRRSSHNPKNLEFVDALIYTNQFDNFGYDYTIKNSENSVTFFYVNWGNTSGDVFSKTTILTINRKGKLSAVDNAIKMGFNGLLGLYNELTGQAYTDFSYNNYSPLTTFNDNFNQMMNGSKLGTFYFPVYEVFLSGWTNTNLYENILTVNFLTGTYELINATAKLQDVVDAGYFNNAWGGNLNNAFDNITSHPEGILFSLDDDYGTDNIGLDGVTKIWSPEWSNHNVGSVSFYGYPVPLTTRHFDDNHCCPSEPGSYSSTSGYIFDGDSDDYWNLSPNYFYNFYRTTSSYSYGPFFNPGSVNNYIYRFELNPETYNKEPELQTIPKFTGIKYPIISYSTYGPGVIGISVGSVVSDTYQFPTNNGMAFGSSSFYYGGPEQSEAYGSLDLSYWNDSSINPLALVSNLGFPTNYTNNMVIQSVSSYSSYYNRYTNYPVNADQYKGINFGL